MIIEGKIVNHDSETYGQIQISPATGLIERVGENLGKADLKITGLIFPGFVDVHVHAREDASGRLNYKEDYLTCSRAAINGGVVAFADMPNTPAAPVTDEIYEEKKEIAKKSLVDVILYAGVGPGTEPLAANVPYKVYMGPSVGDLFFTSRGQLEDVIIKYRGRHISFHCEDPEILEKNRRESTHSQRRPPAAEIEAIKFALELIEKYELKGKICHLSTSAGLDLIAAAKLAGLAVTCEVTPHHLYFEQPAALQINPPLRTLTDREALIAGLKRGAIDFLASDHAPHTLEQRSQGISGLPGLDTHGAFASWLMKEHRFSAQDIARVCAYNPGEFVNEFLPSSPQPSPSWEGEGERVRVGKGFGYVAEGYVGSLTILDLAKPWKVRGEDLKTKCGWSPYEGIEFPGLVSHTIVRGKIYEHK